MAKETGKPPVRETSMPNLRVKPALSEPDGKPVTSTIFGLGGGKVRILQIASEHRIQARAMNAITRTAQPKPILGCNSLKAMG